MAEQEKTEQATPKKREDERKKGNVFTSKDITTVVSLIISFYAISLFMGIFISGVQGFYLDNMQRVVSIDVLEFDHIKEIFCDFIILFARSVLPACLIIGLATIVSVMGQTKLLVSKELLKFKMERINPLKGFKKIFSMRSLVEVLKSIAKISVMIYLIYGNIKRIVGVVPKSMDWSIDQAVKYMGGEILSMVRTVGIAFAAIAAIDFLYQRWEYEKNIKMSKHEVKEEFKQTEGNPEIKGKRRELQRQYAMQRMMESVKEADVVVRNPTHFAVALKYRLDQDLAPMVVAKGVDHIALKIVAEAEKYNITMVENPPLARSLYKLSEIDEYIPAELYQPVAELMAWIYSQRNKI